MGTLYVMAGGPTEWRLVRGTTAYWSGGPQAWCWAEPDSDGKSFDAAFGSHPQDGVTPGTFDVTMTYNDVGHTIKSGEWTLEPSSDGRWEWQFLALTPEAETVMATDTSSSVIPGGAEVIISAVI